MTTLLSFSLYLNPKMLHQLSTILQLGNNWSGRRQIVYAI